ncbi:hypothetical protein SCOR_08120 [Sulfidibacter corallicola]
MTLGLPHGKKPHDFSTRSNLRNSHPRPAIRFLGPARIHLWREETL